MSAHTVTITPETLVQMLEEFLTDEPEAVVVEDGEILFAFRTAKYSVSGESKCVLHIWSEERNIVRRVLDAEMRGCTLRLEVLRFGQSQPAVLEITADHDHQTITSRRAARMRYRSLLARVLHREYPGFRVAQLSNSPDLKHSFQSGLHTRPAALRPNRFRRAGSECRRGPAVDRCGPHVWHSLDGLPAPASGRTRSG